MKKQQLNTQAKRIKVCKVLVTLSAKGLEPRVTEYIADQYGDQITVTDHLQNNSVNIYSSDFMKTNRAVSLNSHKVIQVFGWCDPDLSPDLTNKLTDYVFELAETVKKEATQMLKHVPSKGPSAFEKGWIAREKFLIDNKWLGADYLDAAPAYTSEDLKKYNN